MYCDPQALASEIETAQVTGTISDRLIDIVTKIADGIHSKFYRDIDRDDFTQACLLRFLNVLNRIDTSLTPFNYLSRMCRFEGQMRIRTRKAEAHKLNNYWQHAA